MITTGRANLAGERKTRKVSTALASWLDAGAGTPANSATENTGTLDHSFSGWRGACASPLP